MNNIITKRHLLILLIIVSLLMITWYSYTSTTAAIVKALKVSDGKIFFRYNIGETMELRIPYGIYKLIEEQEYYLISYRKRIGQQPRLVSIEPIDEKVDLDF